MKNKNKIAKKHIVLATPVVLIAVAAIAFFVEPIRDAIIGFIADIINALVLSNIFLCNIAVIVAFIILIGLSLYSFFRIK